MVKKQKSWLPMAYEKVKIPETGEKITVGENGLKVPKNPIIPYIEGDGIGFDIWAAAVRVIDSAVEKAYNGQKKISWMEVYAGDKANTIYGTGNLLPEETLNILKEYKVAIKGPMTKNHSGKQGYINVAIRQNLDLYASIRPVRYFPGVPAPVKKPQDVDMVVFRENTEDIYSGIEFSFDSPEAAELKNFLKEKKMLWKVRFPETSSFGIKPVSREGAERIARAAIQYAIEYKKTSVAIVHKGSVLKNTEGSFAKWAYDLAKKEFAEQVIFWEECGGNPPPGKILIKDILVDEFLQQMLIRPSDYSIILTMNLNGEFISRALAAQVGTVGITPGANINYETGIAVFEATHDSTPKYAGLDKVNPSSLILSGAMMLRYMGWNDAAVKIEAAVEKTISEKTVTYDFARLMDGAKEVKCSEFGNALIEIM